MRCLSYYISLSLGVLAATLTQAQDRPRIVAVNYPLQYMAQQIVGDAADVLFPVPGEVDPSFWRPPIAAISDIQSADLILLNGAGFATWVDRVSLPRAKVTNTTSAAEDRFIVTESITHSHGEGDEHSHEGLASYTWLDPTLALAQAEAIAAAIIAKDIVPEKDVEIALATLRAKLESLDAMAETATAELSDVKMIATHPRYQYFARRYGLSIEELEWEAGAMPTDAEVAALRAMVEATGATVMIWEAKPPAAAFEVTEGLGLRNVVFPTLAHQPGDDDYAETIRKAVGEMSGG